MKHIIILCLVVVLVGLVPALYLCSSRTDLLNTNTGSAEVIRIRSEVPNLAEYAEELESAEMILKVCFCGNRELMYRSVLSEVEVIDVIKGDIALNGSHIAVYERGFYLLQNGNPVFNCATYRTPMNQETDYIVFVKKLANRRSRSMGLDEYTQDWSQKMMELPCLINDDPSEMNVLVTESPISCSELTGYDSIVTNPEASAAVISMESAIREHFS